MKRALATFVLTVAPASMLIGNASAIEAATTGSQATQATVGILNSKVDVTNAIVQNIMACNASRKFYAPSDSKKDANGCVGIQDYNLTMSSTNGIGSSGQINATNTSAGNTWAGYFYNSASNSYGGLIADGDQLGVYGHSAHGQGVYGVSDNNWGGYFTGSTSGASGIGSTYGLYGTATGNGYGVTGQASASGGVGGSFSGQNSGIRAYGDVYGVYGIGNTGGALGVYGQSPNVGVYGYSTGSWGGEFIGTYGVYGQSTSTWAGEFYGYTSGSGGVYIGNAYNNAQLCLNGTCTTGMGKAWGGEFGMQTGNGWGWPGECTGSNPYTGGCSCPSGFSDTAWETGTDVHWVMYHHICYK